MQNRNVDPVQFKWITIGVMAAVGIVFHGNYGWYLFPALYGLLTRKLLAKLPGTQAHGRPSPFFLPEVALLVGFLIGNGIPLSGMTFRNEGCCSMAYSSFSMISSTDSLPRNRIAGVP